MPAPDPFMESMSGLQHPGLDKILYYPSLDSTNLEARRLRSKYPDKNLLVISSEQTKGRGQYGREWVSTSKKGVWMSLLFQNSFLHDFPLNLLSLYTGVVVQGTLQPYSASPVCLKWPNDVVIQSKKVGGILTEMQWSGATPSSVIIGIGVNIHHAPEDFPPEIRSQATSLAQESTVDVNPGQIAQEIIDHFFTGINNPSAPEEIKDAWNKAACQMGEEIEYSKGQKLLRGIFQGVNSSGHALIQTKTGVQPFLTGEIRIKQRV